MRGSVRKSAIALVLVASACHRRGDAPASRGTSPAGGAAASETAGENVTDGARVYPTKTWSFPLERYDVAIEDVGMTTALDAVLKKSEAELAINGGFFGEDKKPLGLAISKGERLAPLARSLSGGVLAIDGDRASLFATETYGEKDAEAPTHFAVQCRPRLVVDGALNIKRDDGKRSERTALCIKDGGKTIEVALVRGDGEEAGPSLFALGKWLAARGCEGALNLDGGPSTGAAWKEGADVRSEPPRGPIRHAIVFRKR